MKNVGLEQRRSSNRLASGYRINSAADDAAGLAISETMRAQIRGLDQASRNAQDGQAMLLTTEGGLEEIGNMLQRVRELLVQASNDTNTQDQRSMIEQEVGQLGREILSMQNRVEFNSNRVLAMGPAAPGDITTTAAEMELSNINAATWGAELNGFLNDINRAIDLFNELPAGNTSWGGAHASALAAVTAGQTFSTSVGGLGGTAPTTIVGTLADTANVGEVVASLNALRSSVMSTQGAALRTYSTAIRTAFSSQYTAARSFATADSSGDNVAWFQVGANSSQGINFDFETVSRVTTAAGWIVRSAASAMAAPGSGSGIGYGIDVTTLINGINSSLQDVNRVRANLGSVQNRMDYTMRSLDISSENLSDSESRVRNADMAREMMRFTMANVLQQSSVSMLAQANQLPNNLLQLLR